MEIYAYIDGRKEFNSRTGNEFLKKFGKHWRQIAGEDAGRAIGNIINQVFVGDLKRDAEEKEGKPERSSYYIYTNSDLDD